MTTKLTKESGFHEIHKLFESQIKSLASEEIPVSQLIEDTMTREASQKNDFNNKGLRDALEIDESLEFIQK